MDILKSPLNLAHQESRKAERYLKAGRYDEAIRCHQKAADCLSEAMAMTTVQQALESLSLQKQFHSRQQAVIEDRRNRSACKEELSEKDKPALTKLADSKESRATNTATLGLVADTSDGEQLSGDVYKTLGDCDSLLQFLNERARASGKVVSLKAKLGAGTLSLGSVKAETKEAPMPKNAEEANAAENTDKVLKPAKSDAVIIEELRLRNVALQTHILDLLNEGEENQRQMDYTRRELDYLRAENRRVKERLQRLESHKHDTSDSPLASTTDTFYSFPAGMALNMDNLPSLDLPPLEVPRFDFNMLKGADDVDDTGTST